MKRFTYLLLAAAALLVSCSHDKGLPSAQRGVYHWKTTYDPTEWEKEWMKEHRVGRLYVKLFDVVTGEAANEPDWKMVPEATTIFKQKLPADMDVVPVVYITVDAIRALEYDEWDWSESAPLYARLLVKRIDDMMAEHYDGTVREVQLDCDWTDQTETAWFSFVHKVKELLHKRNICLSGTLRLHQLHEVAWPRVDRWGDADSIPFDRSLLMCYNTGRLQAPDTRNSILDFDDVEPYLKQYILDSLPRTDVAYPVYGWGVEFDKQGKFQRLINSRQLSDNLRSQQKRNVTIREEWGEPGEIRRTQRALPVLDNPHTTILYHLDSLNLSRYSYEEIEAFYNR